MIPPFRFCSPRGIRGAAAPPTVEMMKSKGHDILTLNLDRKGIF